MRPRTLWARRILLASPLLLAIGCSDRTSPADSALPDRAIPDARGERALRDAAPEARADALQPDTKPRPPARWDPTSSMSQGRKLHSATLLLDGSVLVVGGLIHHATDGYKAVTSAERYDPKNGTWSAAGNLSDGRYAHDAVRLPDGRVLVVGGCRGYYSSCQDVADTVEIYDPATPTVWKSANKQLQPRFGAAVTLMQDGRVLAAGGFAGTNFKSLEIYDPKAGTWSSPASTLPSARSRATATTLPSGLVLLAGGYDGNAQAPLGSLVTFDPKTGSLSAVAAKLAEPRYLHTASLLASGRVLFVGGVCDDLVTPYCETKDAELYDPKVDTVAAVGSPAAGVRAHSATLLQDGNLLLVGGSSTADQVRLFVPSSSSWTQTAALAEPRSEHTATLLQDGRVLVAGGFVYGAEEARKTAEIYTP